MPELLSRENASRVPRPIVSGRATASSQFLDQLSTRRHAQECQRPVGKQQAGNDEGDRRGDLEPFQAGR
jgi:hypothetical protein